MTGGLFATVAGPAKRRFNPAATAGGRSTSAEIWGRETFKNCRNIWEKRGIDGIRKNITLAKEKTWIDPMRQAISPPL
jgi:hypothetical protein